MLLPRHSALADQVLKTSPSAEARRRIHEAVTGGDAEAGDGGDGGDGQGTGTEGLFCHHNHLLWSIVLLRVSLAPGGGGSIGVVLRVLFGQSSKGSRTIFWGPLLLTRSSVWYICSDKLCEVTARSCGCFTEKAHFPQPLL